MGTVQYGGNQYERSPEKIHVPYSSLPVICTCFKKYLGLLKVDWADRGPCLVV